MRTHRDNGVLDGRAEVPLRGFLHLCQNEGADLRGGVDLPVGRRDPSVPVRRPAYLVRHHFPAGTISGSRFGSQQFHLFPGEKSLCFERKGDQDSGQKKGLLVNPTSN